MYDSSQIDVSLVQEFKKFYRAELNFKMSAPEKLALAEAFRQLSVEFFGEAANIENMPNVRNENRNLQPEQPVHGEAGRIQQ